MAYPHPLLIAGVMNKVYPQEQTGDNPAQPRLRDASAATIVSVVPKPVFLQADTKYQQ